MQEIALWDLKRQGLVCDSYFEGDGRNWIGCYAFKKGQPAYWADESDLPKDGIDHSEYFEWNIRALERLEREMNG